MLNRQKIDRDPFYSGLIHLGDNFLRNAGYYEDSIDGTIDYLERQCITPFKCLKPYKPRFKNIVLLTTGSFNPIHLGHIKMVEIAEGYLSEKGYNVLGAYFSASHDKYVKEKKQCDFLPSNVRTSVVNKMLRQNNYDTYSTHSWESMHLPGDVNFTEVITHLKKQFDKYYGEEVEVCYVFGSDNFNFVNTFINKGMCVCVERPNYPFSECDLTNIKNSNNERNVSLVKSAETINISSSEVILNSEFNELKEDLLNKTINLRTNRIYREFNDIFNKYITVNEESLHTTNLTKRFKNEYVLSIDKHSIGDSNVVFSRCFDTYGFNKIGYEGELSLRIELSRIKTSKKILVIDDDEHTGGTKKEVYKILSDMQIPYYEFKTIRQNVNDIEINEIGDIVDFIVTSRDGLLVSGERLPYLFPLMSPYERCGIVDELNFSAEMWSLNGEICGDMLVQDSSFKTKLNELGFSGDTKMHSVCQYFVSYINYCLG